MKPPYRIGLIGATIYGNRGAEAMLTTAIGEVRRRFPDAQFTVFSYMPSDDRRLITDRSVHIKSATPLRLLFAHLPSALLVWAGKRLGIKIPDSLLSSDIQRLRECDVLLDVNGISFADGRAIFLPFKILNIWPAMLVGTPVVKLSQAMGPFREAVTRFAGRLFLPHCKLIFARGDFTFAGLSDVSATNVKHAPDVAFLFDAEYALTTEGGDRLKNSIWSAQETTGSLKIAIIPSAVVYQKSRRDKLDYLGRLVDVILSLPPDSRIVVLPNATRSNSESLRNNDLPVVQLLKARLASARVDQARPQIAWIDYDLNTAETREIIEQADLLITSRFHGMVSGLSLRVPTVVIGWSHKYSEVLKQFDLEHLSVDYKEDRVVEELVENVLSQRNEVRYQIAARLPDVRRSSQSQFDAVEALLLSAWTEGKGQSHKHFDHNPR